MSRLDDRLFKDLAFRLRTLLRRDRQEDELEEELRFHLDMEIERRVEAGEDRASATRAARLDFGNPEVLREECRDAWGIRLVDNAWRDLRGALRHLRKEPRFALVAVGSLAIGIGAAAVMFSVVDAVLLRPFPFHEPERVVAFREINPSGDPFSTSDANLLDFAARSRSLSDLAALSFPPPRPALEQSGERLRLDALAVTPAFFRVLGIGAQHGRVFEPGDSAPGGAPRLAVLSDSAWQRYFGADPAILDRTIDLDGEAWSVLGILPADFRFGGEVPDLFLPYVPDPTLERGDHRLDAFARLAPGATVEQARAEVAAIAARLGEEYPESNAGWSAEVAPIDEYFLGPTVRRTHWVLLGAVGLLLVLACVNVSNLLLARAADRAAEIRLRLALGAGRRRLLGQLLTESALLSLLGAVGGLALALWMVPVVRGLDVNLPRLDQMGVDLRVVAFTALAAVASCLAIGLIPAWRATSTSPAESLQTRTHGSIPGAGRLRSVLVASEVALATILMMGAALLLRSFAELQQVDSGFDGSGVLLVQIDLPQERYPEESGTSQAFYDRLLERVEALPKVESAAASIISPFRGPAPSNTVGPATAVEREAFVQVQWRSVTPHYFRALRIPLLRGRSFEERGEARMEAVVSARLAARLWPEQDPVGEQIRWIGPDGPLFEIIGVAGDVQDLRLGQAPSPMIYLPQRLVGWPAMTLAVRSDAPLEPLGPAIRSVLHELDPLLAAPSISTLDGQRREALAQPLLSLRLMGAFAVLALLLAAVGVYGIVTYAVSRRRHELGLRAALGARPRQLTHLFVRDSARTLLAGLGAGLLGALALVGTLRALLYETSPFDPRVLGSVVLLLAAVGLLAAWMPAMRAARLDPVKALREE